MKYLVVPRMRVQAANMMGASFLMGGPPLCAAYGFGEALCHHAGGGAKVTGVALIHHDREALGQSFYGVFSPQQRRGAAFTFGKSSRGSDYSSKNEHALSLQPVACAHMSVSVVWELEQMADMHAAEAFLHGARFAGGDIVRHGPVYECRSMEEALRGIGGGYVLTDRRDLLENRQKDQASLMVEALGEVPDAEKGNSWLAAACVGYAAVTPFEHRSGVRNGFLHAFAEPLVGMVQYCSLRTWLREHDAEEALWRPVWPEDAGDVFVLRQDTEESVDW